jgi:hypothetical protein
MTYYDGWEFSLYMGDTEGIHMLIKATLDDNRNPGQKFSFEVYSPVPPQVSLRSFELLVMSRLNRIAVHESMERLQIDGKPIVDPHRPNADRDLIEL